MRVSSKRVEEVSVETVRLMIELDETLEVINHRFYNGFNRKKNIDTLKNFANALAPFVELHKQLQTEINKNQ